ncbi:ead/Ea22-like family protein [Salmonella enterica]|nr:ead/Ea22-like family protein [Salmonella enterica]EEA0375674.1 ead/Ea22-like family protein [Salmonella enterica subsp. enterica serovar Newport]EEH1028900.1 ead/Ea22-like family protein [Salmonella enterica]EEP7563607.1 ead/Ea22-like family protein [Salmonella enterica]EGI0012374.1 ead/Ea22-like family protein [Salmonella enterica]
MSNIDKQALREVAEKATRGPWEMERENIWFTDEDGYTKHLAYVQQGDDVDDKQDHYNTAFIAAFNPKVALALLDENLQLQREKDATEAVALALRDDMRQAREQLAAAEKRNAEQRNAEQREYYEGVIADGSKRIAELEKGHQEAAKQINSWRRLAKQNIAERGKDISELEAARQRIAEQSAIVAAAEKLVRCKGRYHSEQNYRALAKLFGVVTPDLPPLEHENVHYADAAEVEITALRQHIQELEEKLETADKLQDSAFRDGLKAGFSYGQTDDQSGFAQCMSAYSTRANIKVKGE